MANPTGSILLRRGPTADRQAFTPLTGEIIFDSETKEVFVGDGSTPGGIKVSLELPPQEPNPGKFLQTDGAEISWATPIAIANVGVGGIGLTKVIEPDPIDPEITISVITSNATADNTPDTIVSRDESGNFSAENITVANISSSGNITSTSINSILTGGLSSYTDIQSLFEKCTLVAASPSSTADINLATSAVVYYTSNSANSVILNIRADASNTLNSIMDVGQSVTLAVMITCANSTHYVTAVNIDGTTSGVTTNWQGGTAPTSGNANAIDIYSFTVIKTASATFAVFASQTRFG